MFTNLHPLEEFCWKVSFCPKVVLFLWLSFFFFLPAPSVPMLLGQLPINGGGGWGYQPSWCADLVIADLLFSDEFFYQNSYFSPRIKRHWSQWIGNLFKINLFSVCRNLVESAKGPFVTSFHVLNENLCTNTYFIAFVIGEHDVLKNWFIHLSIYTETNKFFSLILIANCVTLWLPVTATSGSHICKFLWETRFVSCFDICENNDWCSSNCLKKGVCFERSWHHRQMLAWYANER